MSARGRSGGIWWGALVVAMVVVVSGCATTKKKDDSPPAAMTDQVRPGAGGWSGHALRLPKGSPVVMSARIDDLLMSLDEAWDWIVDEPDMLGDDGDAFVAFLRSERRNLTTSEGLDPLTPKAWIDLGIDVTRELYVGTYPVTDRDSRAVIETVDRVIREEVGLDEGEPVESALTAAAVLSGDEPLRIYSEISDQIDGLDPMAGFRVVIPLADSEDFVSSLQRFLQELELRRVEPTAELVGDADTAWVYLTDGSDFESILLRVRGDTATVDFLYDVMGAQAAGMGTESETNAALARLENLLEQFPHGRPDAPAPAGVPVTSISVDQQGAADLAMLRGIRQALREARGAGLEERDARFTYNLFRAFESMDHWTLASRQLSGLSYGLFVGERERLFRLGIDLYGAGHAEPLPVSDPAMDIAVSERSLAGSIDIRPMVDETWQDWIGVENPLSAVQNFDSIDFDGALFALSLPRTLAILFTNAEKVFENSLPGWAEPLYEQRELLRRLDVATAGIKIRGLRLTPRIVGVLTLESGMEKADSDALSESMASALANLSRQVDTIQNRSEPEASDEADSNEQGGPPSLAQATPDAEESAAEQGEGLQASALEPGAMKSLEVDGEALRQVQYYWQVEGDQPYLFFSYGLGADEAASEHERIEKSERKSANKIMLFRSEPVALFSLLTFYQPDLFEPIDVGILAQRIGAISFEVTPELRGDVQRIRYDFVVGAPPRLEQQPSETR